MLVEIYGGWKGILNCGLLKRRRLEMELSQKELGNLFITPVSDATVCQWESGKSIPTLFKFKQLCLILQIDPMDLLGMGYIDSEETITESLEKDNDMGKRGLEQLNLI